MDQKISATENQKKPWMTPEYGPTTDDRQPADPTNPYVEQIAKNAMSIYNEDYHKNLAFKHVLCGQVGEVPDPNFPDVKVTYYHLFIKVLLSVKEGQGNVGTLEVTTPETEMEVAVKTEPKKLFYAKLVDN